MTQFFPIADTITATLTQELVAGITVGEVYLFVILVSVFVCAGDPGRRPDDVLDEPRPASARWRGMGRVNARFKTPANAAIAVGVLAALPILVIGPSGGFSVSIAATGLIYLSYLMTNVGVPAARYRGGPRSRPGSASAGGRSP